MSEVLNLAWSEFSSNISETFKSVRKDVEMSDVTLACDDGEISAHKLILFSGSIFFQSLLTKHRHEHPLIFIRGVKVKILRQIVDFMYEGEISVAQEDLQGILETAEDLKVKGLSLKQSHSTGKLRIPQIRNEEAAPTEIEFEKSKDNDQNIIKCEPELLEVGVQFEHYEEEESWIEDPLQAPAHNNANEENFDDWMEVEQKKNDSLDEEALNLMVRVDGPNNRVSWICKVCRKNSSDKTRIRKHVRGKHLQKDKKKENDLKVEEKYKVSFQDDGVVLSSYEEYQAKAESLMEKIELSNNRLAWFCKECRKTNSDKTRIRKHVETHIQDLMFECLFCEARRKSSANMEVHFYKAHPGLDQKVNC